MENSESNSNTFEQRLDFYWQYISAYFVVLLIYGIAKGSIDEGTITMQWKDPVVILLFFFMIISSLFLLYNSLKKKTIIIGNSYIRFRTRTKERTYSIEDINNIFIAKKRNIQMPTTFQIVKIKVKSRKYAIRFRPNSYWNDKELLKSLYELKHEVEISHGKSRK